MSTQYINRFLFTIVFLSYSFGLMGQTTPPGASAASMMSFNNVPVNLCTGTPNITVPLYSLPTHSKDVTVGVSINYHPESKNISDVGKGWTLFAGGMIAKTVFGMPDDLSQISDLDDTYDYSFMGYSGKFVIVNDPPNSSPLLVNLDGNTLKIEYNYTGTGKDPQGFTIYDDKGYRYIFGLGDNDNPGNIAANKYGSTWVLEEIKDNNDMVLASFSYLTHPVEHSGVVVKNYRKLQEIFAVGVGRIFFEYSYTEPASGNEHFYKDPYSLTEITVETPGGETIKGFEFIGRLSQINEYDKTFTESKVYKFEYTNMDPPPPVPTDDEWYGERDYSSYWHLNCTSGGSDPGQVLKAIVFPTGGQVEYDFEFNTYSEGDDNTSDFELHNPHNKLAEVLDYTFYDTAVTNTWTFTVPGTEAKKLYFKYENNNYYYLEAYDIGDPVHQPLPITYKLYSGSTATGTPIFTDGQDPGEDLCAGIGTLHALEPGTYTFEIVRYGMPLSHVEHATGGIHVTEVYANPVQENWIYDKGLRIKQISYYDKYDGSDILSRQINYDYRDFADASKSSGIFIIGYDDLNTPPGYIGSQVYYKNVKVYDTGDNGYTKYTFVELSEHTNLGLGETYFTIFDKAKGGILKKKEVFNDAHELQQMTANSYEVSFTNPPPYIYTRNFGDGSTSLISWVKLIGTVDTKYRNTSLTTPPSLNTIASYTYNPDNHLPASVTTTTSEEDTVVTNYTYHTGDSSVSQNRISEPSLVETTFNGNTISSSQISYTQWGTTGRYLPEAVGASKASEGIETKIVYSRYDNYGNVLETTRSDGFVTSYIWGYHSTLPIAKIENASYAVVEDVAHDLLIYSNGEGTTAETTLLSYLSALYTLSGLENAMITTYTYKPLYGISTVTDPKRMRTTYEYDDFGRLKATYDNLGKLITSNEYHYDDTGETRNYVRTVNYKIDTDVIESLPEVADAQTVTTFYDGLGRTIQKNAYHASPKGYDIVTHMAYDPFGRQAKSFLPYVNERSGGVFDADAFENTKNFYEIDYSINTGFFYGESFFEHSPLNRVRKQAAPGETWKGNTGNDNDHTIRFVYAFNEEDEVKHYSVTTDSEYLPTLVDNGYYNPELLYKNITRNENWTSGTNNTTEEFKDKNGRIVLKRTYGTSVVGDTPTSNLKHDTYYVYDEFGNLTYVIPPKVNTEQTISQTILDNLCYQYKYDYRNRMIEKKLPGKRKEFIVYDRLDRPVGTGPTMSPFGEAEMGWLMTKYDVFGRVAYTLWFRYSDFGEESKIEEFRNNWQSGDLFETKTESSPNGIVNVWSSNVFPTSDYILLTMNYYDDYDFTGGPGEIPSTIYGELTTTETETLKGMSTGSWVRALTGSSDGETSYIIYDRRYRNLRTHTTNYLGGYTRMDTDYNDSGQIAQTKTTHKRLDSDTEIQVKDDYIYTDQGRLNAHTHTINSGDPQLLAHYEYDDLGKAISKDVGGNDVTNFDGLQNVDYAYNIRGWLTDINNTSLLGEDLFAFKIRYNNPIDSTPFISGDTTPAQYNGNISEIFWRSKSDDVQRKYAFHYDEMNRLREAVYQKPEQSNVVTHSYDESMQYDKNGNITQLNRYGDIDDPSGFQLRIDALDYFYAETSNKLMKVTDYENDPSGFKDDSDGYDDNDDDYKYDDWGNLTSDQNKEIESISYNHLNLPVEILMKSADKITYLYDALGRKLKKTVTKGTSNVTDYMGFQYLNGGMVFFPHAEGYVDVSYGLGENATFYNYVFNFTDHLGNIRMSWALNTENDQLAILEESHYYPYGLKHRNYNSDLQDFEMDGEGEDAQPIITYLEGDGWRLYKQKYNGKEWQDELGLNMTAMDFRQYDNAIGRFNCIDVLAEITNSVTPYNFTGGNPNYFADPSGLKWWHMFPSTGGGTMLDVMFNTTPQGQNSVWDNNGHGGFDNTNGYESVTYGGSYTDIRKYLDNLQYVVLPPLAVGEGQNPTLEAIQSNAYSNSPFYEYLRIGQDIVSMGGGFMTLWGESLKYGATYNPKYAQSAETMASKGAEALRMGKYAKYVSRIGNTLTGAGAILSIIEYGYSDRSWGDKTKLGVNIGLAGLGLSGNGYAIFASIALGITETAGGFDGLYQQADTVQRTGVINIPSGIVGPYPTVIYLH